MSLSSVMSSTASEALTNPRTNVDSAGSQFGQDQFLTLMLAQLRNQDPLKPLEPSEFLGQLAQFSTVTGIQDMKGSVGELAEAITRRTATAVEDPFDPAHYLGEGRSFGHLLGGLAGE